MSMFATGFWDNILNKDSKKDGSDENHGEEADVSTSSSVNDTGVEATLEGSAAEESTASKDGEQPDGGGGDGKGGSNFRSGLQDLKRMATNFGSLVSGNMGTKGGGSTGAVDTAVDTDKTIEEIVSQVREAYEQHDEVTEGKMSLSSILTMLEQHREQLNKVAEKYIASNDVDFDEVRPHVVYYYMEHEDEVKNPSWKRRKHRFCRGLSIDNVQNLNSMFELAVISYCDTEDEIRTELDQHSDLPCELVYADVNSEPGRPANYVAVPRDQRASSKWLHVVIGVRGTKTVADAVTDVLCDAVPYQDGKAHSYIVESGKYVYDKHRPLLDDLLRSSGKRRIKLTLVGHSLGAGAASIAAMEWNSNKKDGPKTVSATVFGFGCPALVSEDLAAKSTSYITTVVNDSDVVPRMSGATIANLFLNLMDFDWTPYARLDVDHASTELNRNLPNVFTAALVQQVTNSVGPALDEVSEKRREKNSEVGGAKKERGSVPVELFPPGRCVHFWRDGNGISANYVPNTFFNEVDVCWRMLDDHLCHGGYEQVFLEIVRQHTKDHHFRFDEDEKASSP